MREKREGRRRQTGEKTEKNRIVTTLSQQHWDNCPFLHRNNVTGIRGFGPPDIIQPLVFMEWLCC